MQAESLLTVAEVAGILRLSEKTVYGLVKTGQLPAKRVGRRIKVRPGDVRAYVEALPAA